MPEPSLLDIFKAIFTGRRVVRGLLALAAAFLILNSLMLWLDPKKSDFEKATSLEAMGYFAIGVLLALGTAVLRGAPGKTASVTEVLSAFEPSVPVPPAPGDKTPGVSLKTLALWLGLPSAVLLALGGQWILLQALKTNTTPWWGIGLLGVGIAGLIVAVWHHTLDWRKPQPPAAVEEPESTAANLSVTSAETDVLPPSVAVEETLFVAEPDSIAAVLPIPSDTEGMLAVQPARVEDLAAPKERVNVSVRWWAVAAAALLSVGTFFLVPNNDFTLPGRMTWIASLVLWLVAFWEGPLPLTKFDWRAAFDRLWRGEVNIRLTRTLFLLIGVMLVTAVFRYSQLNEVPGEMTSDHVEKLLDVNDIVQGRWPIFEPNNAGREALAFYLMAFTSQAAGTGLTYLTLKLVTATAGFITVLFIFFLAREATDDDLTGLLAALAAGIGWWPNTISRNGLRFSMAPLFATLALWLIIRALKRGQRNDALLAGLAVGIGFYGYTPGRIVPLAVALAVGLYALHSARGLIRLTLVKTLALAGAGLLAGGIGLYVLDILQRPTSLPAALGLTVAGLAALLLALGVYVWRAVNAAVALKSAGWLVMTGVVALAVFVPMLRYAYDDPDMFGHRSASRIFGDDGEHQPTVQEFIQNEWNSVRMFFWTSDDQWLVSPPNQPALDWVMAALLALGTAFLLYRYWRWREWIDLFLIGAILVLLLPSTLALAFPRENPSLHRSGAAIPVVFTVVAVALRLLVVWWRRILPDRRGAVMGAGTAAALLLVSAQLNWQVMFEDYPPAYLLGAQNASEIGQVVHDFAHSTGSYETAYVVSFPYWVDSRAVGMYAGRFGWNQAICADACVFQNIQSVPATTAAQLFILHRNDQPNLDALRAAFPAGRVARYDSPRPERDFLMYVVPATADQNLTVPPAP